MNSMTVSGDPSADATLTVSWQDLDKPDRRDWIALMRKTSDGDSMFVIYDTVNAKTPFFRWLDGSTGTPQAPTGFNFPAVPGPASGSIPYKLPDYMPAGEYFLRLWRWTGKVPFDRPCTDGTYIDTSTFHVTSKQATLKLSATDVADGTAITVEWSGVTEPSVNDHFVLYPLGKPFLGHSSEHSGAEPGLPTQPYLAVYWYWMYPDGTKKDNVAMAPRGQASGSFSFPIPKGLIEGDYIVYMVRNRTGAGYTPRTICGHSDPIKVSGTQYPADLPVLDIPGNPADIMVTDCTSEETVKNSAAPAIQFFGPYEFGKDGNINYLRTASSWHHTSFEFHTDKSLPLREAYAGYLLYLERSFVDGLNGDGGIKMMAETGFHGAPSAGDRTWLERPKFVQQTLNLRDYRQHLGQDDIGIISKANLQPRRWYWIELRMKLNDPGQANGIMQLFCNNHMIGEVLDVRWTDDPAATFVGMGSEIFHGGTQYICAPAGYARVANMSWSTKFIGHPVFDGEDMATPQTVNTKCLDAYNESCDLAGVPNVQGQIDAATASITAERDAALADAAAKQTKIDNATAAAQAEKAADAAHQAGQGVLDALA
jgi:hypothetical protein